MVVFSESVPRLPKCGTHLVRAPSWDKYRLALPLNYAVTLDASLGVQLRAQPFVKVELLRVNWVESAC